MKKINKKKKNIWIKQKDYYKKNVKIILKIKILVVGAK